MNSRKAFCNYSSASQKTWRHCCMLTAASLTVIVIANYDPGNVFFLVLSCDLRLEWEHIQRVLAEHDGNISEAARSLGLHRRTLQRKLDKKPVKF